MLSLDFIKHQARIRDRNIQSMRIDKNGALKIPAQQGCDWSLNPGKAVQVSVS